MITRCDQCKICALSFSGDFCAPTSRQNSFQYHPADCTRFIYCLTNVVSEQSCPVGQVYDLSSGAGQCQNPDSVPCAQETAEVTTSVENSQTEPSVIAASSSLPQSESTQDTQDDQSTDMMATDEISTTGESTEATQMDIISTASTVGTMEQDIQPTESGAVVSTSSMEGWCFL